MGLVYVIGIWILRIFSPDLMIGFWKCSGRVTFAFHFSIPKSKIPTSKNDNSYRTTLRKSGILFGLAVGGPLNGKCFNINMTTRNS